MELLNLVPCASDSFHSTWGRKELYVQLSYDSDVTYSVDNVGDVLTVLVHFVQVLVERGVLLLVDYEY